MRICLWAYGEKKNVTYTLMEYTVNYNIALILLCCHGNSKLLDAVWSGYEYRSDYDGVYLLSIFQTPSRVSRRSRSAGERWLEHRPEPLVELDTVMQPKMKKKRSVNKLGVKDTAKANKYLLTTQDTDERGQIETKLVKVNH